MNEETSGFRKFLKSFWGEVLKILIISLIVVIPFRIYIAQPFLVSGPSMDNTFQDGDYLIVDQVTYKNREPHRGEVVIFKYPLDPKKYFIKRVIGLPEETVEIKNGTVKIINKEYPQGLVLDEPYVKVSESNDRPDTKTTLGKEQYYVMGDNRSVSSDSRIWGAVKRELITGRPLLRLFPLSAVTVLPGQIEEK